MSGGVQRALVLGVLALAALGACGRSRRSEPPAASGEAGSDGESGAPADAGSGGASSGSAGSGGLAGTGGTSSGRAGESGSGGRECGLLIDDIESGTGHICEGVEGRKGVWYAFNDEGEGSTQWPELTTPGVPVPASEIPGGRGSSTHAMHTYGTAFSTWGAGIGFDLAYDGTTYGRYDGSRYSGITFWARGAMGATTQFRVSTAQTTLLEYGGECMLEPCYASFEELFFGNEWRRYWVPFSMVPDPGKLLTERTKLTNVQFLLRNADFDFWIDDISFYTGEADCCPAGCSDVVQYADTRLEQAIKQALHRGSDDPNGVTCNEACTVYSVFFPGYTIDDLSGLECSPGLHTLNLSNSTASNLEALAKLPSLAFASLASEQIADIRPLSGLGELRDLSLGSNHITDISPLSGLDRLKNLTLSYNEVSAVPVPFTLPALEQLYLDSNRLEDLSGLAGAPKLKTLALSSNGLASLATLPRLPELTTLFIGANELEDLSPLAGFTSLTILYANTNRIGNLDALADLPALQTVLLSGNQVTDLSPLAGHASIVQLDVSMNRIESLEGLRGLALQALNVSGNPLTHLGSLEGVFTAELDDTGTFTTFDLSSTNLSDLSELAAAPGLVRSLIINLTGNPIDCVAQAENLAMLQSRVTRVDACL